MTVLFCDVVGSTALGETVDPEALQGLLSGYFERMKAIVGSHGGSVEKFIGDAVMAVFGVPVAREDDALRACRAAVEMRDALPELGVEGRIGVNTGEVLSGTAERLVTGDAVNVAARLEQAAEPGEVLIGAATLTLVATAVEVGDERLLELKGKSEPVAAHVLVGIGEAVERSHASRFVGREQELQQLVDAWNRASTGTCCELVTVVGDPGVGKSRLVAEVLAKIDARVVRGRCLSYGEGITYRPVLEVLKQLDALPSDEATAMPLRSLLGESHTVALTDEIAWAFRKLLEEQAPLVVCFDDIQWGEETFLDLVESTALLSSGAPLLLLCMARPELLDRRPGWPTILRLEPLSAGESEALIGDSLSNELRQRIVRAAGGNPLFLTEMAALSVDGDGDVAAPPTLRALLAARLDQLDEPERRVLECGAVEGELFHRGTVKALALEETDVTPRLAALVRRGFVRPDRPMLPRDDAYRFRHLLVRDAAYDALPKASRADLHRSYAAWLEEHGHGLIELDEILGYHLEQAARCLEELGRPEPEVALDAGDRLAGAGRRAQWRADTRAAAALFDRSLELTRQYRFDVHLEVELVTALSAVDLLRGIEVADAAAARAEALADERGAALARTVAATTRAWASQGTIEEAESFAREALPLLEAAHDHAGLVFIWDALALAANGRAHFEEWALAAEAFLDHSRRSGRPVTSSAGLSMTLALGPRPASTALAALDRLLPEPVDPADLMLRALLLAMLGRTDDARAAAKGAETRASELGHRLAFGWLGHVARVTGDLPLAAAYFETCCEAQEELGHTGALATTVTDLAQVLCELGRHDEAEALADRGRRLSEPDDVSAQAGWRQVTALLYSAHGRDADAEHLAHEAVEWARKSDSPLLLGDALYGLGSVLEAASRRGEAKAAWQEALDRYEHKEILPLARRVRERLEALERA